MEFLAQLWLPILLSAVFVFLASSVLHMVLPLHRSDYQGLAGEAQLMAAMRAQGVKPGQYMFPHAASMKDCGSPEMQAKFNEGPVGILTVMPNGMPNMGKTLAQWFLYTLLISFFAGYLGSFCIPLGADYHTVFRVTGTAAVLGYAFSYIPNSIWKGEKWSTSLKFILDGTLYGLVTAGTFGWLWPAA